VLVLVPAEVPKGLLVESLPFALVTALRGHNGAHLGPEQIRLRMALHAGEVRYDRHGVTGMAVNLAFRLLEAAPLKEALASSPGVLAVITSSWFYAEVARQTPVAGEYHCVDVAVKETTTIAWICLPDRALAIAQLRRPYRSHRVRLVRGNLTAPQPATHHVGDGVNRTGAGHSG
jgi:hypothetical protein